MNIRKSFILVTLLVLIFLAFGFQNSSDHKVIFEKAKFTMETKGDLKGAIKLFSEIIEKYPNERQYAAKSQLYIGLCYEKLGQKKAKLAQKAYQRVIDNYPGQTETVKAAQEKLSGLLKAQTVIEKGDFEFLLRKVGPSLYPGIGLGKISPDGRYISFVDWGTGDLAVQEIYTGKKHLLTHKGSWDESGAMAYQSRWSPDGKRIAYDWWDWDKQPYFVGIRIASPDGSKTRAIYEVKSPMEASFVLGWSPDGKHLLAIAARKHPSDVFQIVLISVDDGSTSILKTLNKYCDANFSPDGNYIIYERPQEDDILRNDIYLLSIDGKKDIPLVEHPANDGLLGCAPDGKSVLFASDRRGTRDAWLLQLEDGQVKGNLMLVQKDIGEIEPLGFTHKGEFYYLSLKSKLNIYVATLNPKTGELTNTPNKFLKYIGQSTDSPAYSPDGNYLAYIAERRLVNNSRFVICVRHLGTGEEQEFYPSHYRMMDIKWSPDSRFLLARASDKKLGSSFFNYILCLVNRETGEIKTLVQCDPDKQLIHSMDWSINRQSIFYVTQNEENGICRLIERNLQSGMEKELFRVSPPKRFFIVSRSPDGEWLSFVEYGKKFLKTLKVIPTTGGEARELHNFESKKGYMCYNTWTPDGKHILFGNPGGVDELWRIPFPEGKPQKLDVSMARFYSLSVHPDGRHLAFSSFGPSEKKAELWVMENFLPLIKK